MVRQAAQAQYKTVVAKYDVRNVRLTDLYFRPKYTKIKLWICNTPSQGMKECNENDVSY